MKALDLRGRRAWRQWLKAHHASMAEIWLLFHKRHTGVECLAYGDAVEEALCFGWIDSIVRRLDDDRYVRKFTPRRPDSVWSPANRRRYRELARRGLLAAPGRERAPTPARSDTVRRPSARLPAYMERALRKNVRAWKAYQALAPSHRRAYVGWVDAAKRAETKARRLAEAVRLLAAGKKLGLK